MDSSTTSTTSKNKHTHTHTHPFAFPELQVAKPAEEKIAILSAMSHNFLFRDLSDSKRKIVVEMMVRVSVSKDEVVIKQGEPGDKFYVVEKGKFEVRVAPTDTHTQKGKEEEVVVHTYEGTDALHPSFGELALIDGARPRAASVVCVSEKGGSLWALDRVCFRAMFFGSVSNALVQTLRQLPPFHALKMKELQGLAAHVESHTHTHATTSTSGSGGTDGNNNNNTHTHKVCTYKEGEVIEPARRGGGGKKSTHKKDKDDGLFLMVKEGVVGVCECVNDTQKEEKKVKTKLRTLDFIVEGALRGGGGGEEEEEEERGEIIAMSTPCVVLRLEGKEVEKVVGKPLSELVPLGGGGGGGGLSLSLSRSSGGGGGKGANHTHTHTQSPSQGSLLPASAAEMERVLLVHEDELGPVFLATWKNGTFGTAPPSATDSPSRTHTHTQYVTLRSMSKAKLLSSGKEALALRRAGLSKLVSSSSFSGGAAAGASVCVDMCASLPPFLPPLLCTLSEPNTFHEIFLGAPIASFRRCLLTPTLTPTQTKSSPFSLKPSSSTSTSPTKNTHPPTHTHTDEPTLKYIAASLLSLLHELHSLQLLFRGIQPDLLYLSTTGRVCVCDFRHSKLGLEKTYTLTGM
jgi:cAMP-dependent protein kinase regulator